MINRDDGVLTRVTGVTGQKEEKEELPVCGIVNINISIIFTNITMLRPEITPMPLFSHLGI